MKYFILLIALFAINFYSDAQSNYKSGYIVNNQNDTIKGFIDQRERFNNPTEFELKASLDQPAKKYSIENISSVGIIGYTYYEKFTTSVSTGYITLNRLSSTIDTGSVIQTVLMRIIKKGNKISLYAYTDNVKTRFYIFDNQKKKLTELDYYVYYSEETKSTVTSSRYQIQLYSIAGKYLPGNTKIIDRINNTAYDETGILKIVQLINGDKADGIAAGKNLFGKDFFIGAGVKNNTLTYTGQLLAFPDGTKKVSTTPTISGGIDLILNKETKKLIFRIEASYAMDKYYVDNVLVFDGADHTYASLDLKMSTFTLYPQIIYNFYSSNAFKVFLDVGFAFNKISYNDYNYVTNNVVSPTLTQTFIKNKYPVFESSDIVVPVKAGFVFNKNIEIYASYGSSSSILHYTGSNAGINYYQAGINYLFGSNK